MTTRNDQRRKPRERSELRRQGAGFSIIRPTSQTTIQLRSLAADTVSEADEELLALINEIATYIDSDGLASKVKTTLTSTFIPRTDSDPIDLQLEFKIAYAKGYSEFSYTGTQLDQIDIWDTASKGTKLFTKAFTYTTGDLTEIELTDELSALVSTKTLTYSGGQLDTLTEVVA